MHDVPHIVACERSAELSQLSENGTNWYFRTVAEIAFRDIAWQRIKRRGCIASATEPEKVTVLQPDVVADAATRL
jgi:hypothetical protein